MRPPHPPTPQHSSEHEPAALWLDSAGVIQDCSDSLEALTGYSSNELVSHPVSAVLPQLSTGYLFRDGHLNPMLEFLTHIGHHFQARKRSGEAFEAELHFVENLSGNKKIIKLLVRPPVSRSPASIWKPPT